MRPIQILPLGFLGIILLGSALLCLPLASRSGQPLPFIDALFTSTSATCVTGLAIGDTGSTFSLFGQIVILIQIQIGGLGFMTMASVLFSLVHKRISLYERMTLMESMGENRLTDITSTAAMAVRLTFITEGIGAFLLAIRFIPLFGLAKGLWYSVFHSISAFCNAGFDIFGTGLSLEGLFTGDIFVNLVVMGLVIVGGLGFTVVYELCSRPRQRRLRLHTRIVLVATGILIALGWVMFCVLEWDGAYNALPGGTRVLAGLFQSVTLRTADRKSVV